MARSYASVVRSGLKTPPAPPRKPALTEPVVRNRLWRGDYYDLNVVLPPGAEAEATWVIFDWNNGVWLPDAGPAPLKAPPCHYCGSAADVCPECARNSWWSSAGLQPVVEGGLCWSHTRYHESHAHVFYSANMEDFIPQTCGRCRAEHPWTKAETLELTGFEYERANMLAPLKSPNGGRFNIVFVPVYRYRRIGQAKSTAEQRAAWAQAAYDKEMEFSGETKRAEVFKAAVLSGDPDPEIRYKLWEAGAE